MHTSVHEDVPLVHSSGGSTDTDGNNSGSVGFETGEGDWPSPGTED
ncbi:MAG: hypothetical protein IJ580_03065 [Prevotella sp.]|nr:hypothetical protein [Prevotella sp.]